MAEDTSVDVAQVEAETHDEIDDIMAEIEKIKSGISTGEPPAAEAQASEEVPAAETQALGGEATEVDFGAANTEAPMEEMLAAAGIEEAASGGALSEPVQAVEAPVDEEIGGQTPGESVAEAPMIEETDLSEVAAAAAAAETPAPSPAFVPKLVAAAPETPTRAVAPSPAAQPRGEASTLQSVVAPQPASVAQLPRAQGEGSLSMTLAGSMRLALKYEQNGQEVSIRFEDEFLRISLADGTEFKVPVGRSRRNVA
jgi:hypothetical protein